MSFCKFALVACTAGLMLGQQPPAPAGAPRPAPLRLTIPVLPDGGTLPDKYSCVAEAAALRPRIQWTGGPATVASYVLLMHDADVHPGRGMYDNTHWIVWNIPGDAKEIPEGAPNAEIPGAVMGRNTSGMPPGYAREIAYAPPCAPVGAPHHYWFELFALDTKIDLPASATRDQVVRAMDTHVIGKAVSTGLFSRH